jgi:hypothetical protein
VIYKLSQHFITLPQVSFDLVAGVITLYIVLLTFALNRAADLARQTREEVMTFFAMLDLGSALLLQKFIDQSGRDGVPNH